MNLHFMSNRPARMALLAALVLPVGVYVTPAQAAPFPQLDPQPTAQAASAETPVPAALFQSVFADLPKGVEQTSLDWKKANADVGQFKRGHADLLKWEQEQAKLQPKTPEQPSSTPTR